jgi:hypothetical protein
MAAFPEFQPHLQFHGCDCNQPVEDMQSLPGNQRSDHLLTSALHPDVSYHHTGVVLPVPLSSSHVEHRERTLTRFNGAWGRTFLLATLRHYSTYVSKQRTGRDRLREVKNGGMRSDYRGEG